MKKITLSIALLILSIVALSGISMAADSTRSITSFPAVTPATDDKIVISDTSSSGAFATSTPALMRGAMGLATTDSPSFTGVNASGGGLTASDIQVVKAWFPATTYTADRSAVIHGGATYICKANHTSSIAGAVGDEPGVGDTWTTQWKYWGEDHPTIISPMVTAPVRNVTGSPIAAGKWVYITGATGSRATIALATNASYTASHVAGITTAAINNNANGYIATTGSWTGDTSGFNDGDELYLGTAGDAVTSAPAAPALEVPLGFVKYSNPAVGLILLSVHHPVPGATEMIEKFNSGTCSGYLKSDGSCDTPAGIDDQTAAEVAFTPNGSIAATDVQAAIQEVRDEAGGGGYTNLTSFIAQTPWRLFYSNADGDVTELALGADGEYLKSNGAALAPSWATPSGAAHDAVTIGTPANGLSISTQELSLGLASTSTIGALSDTDWDTFNNKLSTSGDSALSLGVASTTTGLLNFYNSAKAHPTGIYSAGADIPSVGIRLPSTMPAGDSFAVFDTNGYWSWLTTASKQDALVSGTSIKTVNSTSLLGSGDVAVGTVDTANSPQANDIARFTDADTIEGLSYSELAAILDGEAWTFTGAVDMSGASSVLMGPISFEGATADDFETTFSITDPTADRTITVLNVDSTIPAATSIDASGKILTAGLADTDLATYADITPSANVQSLLGAADYAAMRGLLDLEAGTDFNAYDADLPIDAIEFVIDGGGSAITTGVKGFLEVPYAATINRATVLCDQSGSIVVDVWKDTYANYPPTDADSITASAPPTVSTATASQDATLTGWTTSITSGDIIGFNVDSITTVTRCTVSLRVSK